MAKKVKIMLKLQLPAGKATPAPPVGTALGPHGVNIAAFVKEFNDKTREMGDTVIPVEMTVYEDRSFSFILKTPPEKFNPALPVWWLNSPRQEVHLPVPSLGWVMVFSASPEIPRDIFETFASSLRLPPR